MRCCGWLVGVVRIGAGQPTVHEAVHLLRQEMSQGLDGTLCPQLQRLLMIEVDCAYNCWSFTNRTHHAPISGFMWKFLNRTSNTS